MSMKDDHIDERDSTAHVEFMRQLVENVKLMLGGEAMVAAVGNENNGVYGIMICVNNLPGSLVIMSVMSMLADQMLKDMAKRHNALCGEEMGESTSKFVN